MMELCFICGERMATKICTCGFDASKNYDCYRTLSMIQSNLMSTYIKHKNHEKKLIDEAVNRNLTENKIVFGNGMSTQNETEQDYEQGMRHYRSKVYQGAHYYLAKAAENGNPKAMNILGNMYYLGQGTAKDLDKAKEWYTKAASLGDEMAVANLYKRFNTKK